MEPNLILSGPAPMLLAGTILVLGLPAFLTLLPCTIFRGNQIVSWKEVGKGTEYSSGAACRGRMAVILRVRSKLAGNDSARQAGAVD